MTTEPESPLRDPALDAAWRARSNEQPPAQLDAAILTAAHRAVEGEAKARRAPSGAASARRWWMPLATAATIAGVVVGVSRLASQEQAAMAPSVSEIPAREVAPRSDQAAADAFAEGREVGIASKRAAEAPEADAAAPAASPRAPAPSEAFVPSPPERGRVAALGAVEDAASGSAPAELPSALSEELAPAPPALPAAEAGRQPMASAAPSSKAQAASPVEADARIARIRNLHERGELAEAAKELEALRAAVPDADRRLPPELRAWAATVEPR